MYLNRCRLELCQHPTGGCRVLHTFYLVLRKPLLGRKGMSKNMRKEKQNDGKRKEGKKGRREEERREYRRDCWGTDAAVRNRSTEDKIQQCLYLTTRRLNYLQIATSDWHYSVIGGTRNEACVCRGRSMPAAGLFHTEIRFRLTTPADVHSSRLLYITRPSFMLH